MIEVIIFVLGVALLLYVLLGGADFGAGIVEIFTGTRGINTISHAVAPVWEANHVWIILVVVVIFNGFPQVFSTLSIYLHIPLLIILVGIIFRGCAFTFRYYDALKDGSQRYYSVFFRISSIITPLFYGITLGAIISGRIPSQLPSDFFHGYIYPWFSLFSLATGIFTVILFGWIASVFLIGESKDEESRTLFIHVARNFYIALVIAGLLVFLSAELYSIHFFKMFFSSGLSVVCVVAATLVIPVLWYSIKSHNVQLTRLLAGAQVACILAGWFAVQLPVMVNLSEGKTLTIYNSSAPSSTMLMLMLALIVGVLIIFPAFIYLFKVFKFGAGKRVNENE